MELWFQGGGEYVKLKIDRINHTFEIGSSKTNYAFASQPFNKLFDNSEEQAEMELVDDKKFIKTITNSFQKVGYKIIKVS